MLVVDLDEGPEEAKVFAELFGELGVLLIALRVVLRASS